MPNTAPQLTNYPTSLTLYENELKNFILPFRNLLFADPDNNFNGGTITIRGVAADERIGLFEYYNANMSFTGNEVRWQGVVIGIVSGGEGSDFSVALNANATSAMVQVLLRAIRYTNSSDTPTAQRSLTINVTDADGADFGPVAGATDGARGIRIPFNIIAQDGYTQFDLNGSAPGRSHAVTWVEDSGPVLVAPNGVYSDPDGGPAYGTIKTLGFSGYVKMTILHQGDGPGQIGFDGTTVRYGGVAIGSFVSSGYVHFSQAVSNETVTALIQRIAFVDSINYENHNSPGLTRTVTFRVEKTPYGSPGEDSQDVAVTIQLVNDAPAISLWIISRAIYDRGKAPYIIESSADVSDPDSATMASATVEIAAGFSPGDILSLANPSRPIGNIAASYDAAAGRLTLLSEGATATKEEWSHALRLVSYSNNSYDLVAGERSFAFRITDSGGATSQPAIRSMSVTNINDGAILTRGGGPEYLSYTEQGPPLTLLPHALLTDDSPHFAGATLTIAYDGFGPHPGNQLAIASVGGISVVGAEVRYQGIAIGTFSTPSVSTPLAFALNGSATPEAVQALVRTITFQNMLDNPNLFSRFAFRLTEADGVASSILQAGVDIRSVDDPASFDINGAASGSNVSFIYEPGEAWRSLAPEALFADPDSGLSATLNVRIEQPQSGDSLSVFAGEEVQLWNGYLFYKGYSLPVLSMTATQVILYLENVHASVVTEIVRSFGFSNPSETAWGSRTISLSLSGSFNASATIDVFIDSTGQGTLGTAMADVLEGGTGNDLFQLQQGGDDRASGGDGNDVFYLGGALTAGARFDGGAGHDQLLLQGDYHFEFAAQTILRVESVALLSGSDTGFGQSGAQRFDYRLITDDANVAAGERLVIDGSRLLAGEDFFFNGSREADGSFALFGGGGRDTLIGATGSDRFYFSSATFGSGDQVNGLSGGDDWLVLRGLFSTEFAANTIQNIDRLTLISVTDPRFSGGTGPFGYDLKSNDGNVASGERLFVEGGGLIATETLKFDGSAETDGSFRMLGGAAADILTGGAGDDLIEGGAGNDTLNGGGGVDDMRGGTGSDIYIVDNAGDLVRELAGAGVDEVRTALSNYALPDNVEHLVYTGTGAASFSGNALDNVITASASGGVLFLQQGGNDRVLGGNGNDGFYFGNAFTATDVADGGAGTDQLALQGAYNLALGAGSIAGIETIALLSGADARFGDTANNRYDYALTMHDGNVAAGQLLTINLNGLLAGEDFTFDGSAETNGAFQIFAGFGKETLTGGAGNDGFFFGEGRFNAGDKVVGGTGSEDQVALRGDYVIDFNAAGYAGNLVGIDTIALISSNHPLFGSAAGDGEFDYALTLSDALADGGRFTVSGTSLGATETMVVDGSAETSAMLRLFGGASADTLTGGAGGDHFFGGLGADTLRGNGGADIFFYTDKAQSAGASIDSILGFAAGADKIDLSAIDADSNADGNQAFAWSNDGSFHGVAGEVRATWDAANNRWIVEADVDGNGGADFTVHVTTVDNAPLGAGDFIF